MNSTPVYDYDSWLSTKRRQTPCVGIDISASDVHPMLYPFQRDIVRWAVKRGRAAIFADCGLGKTLMQLEWARQLGGRCLIVCPLCVAEQTVAEGAKIGLAVKHIRDRAAVDGNGIYITNYEMLHHQQAEDWTALVLDESSILKSYTGVYRQRLTKFAEAIPFRLACTATPAPNDITEIINHAEFLDIMSGKEILAVYFRQDGNSTHAWRLKGHAINDYWAWLASWAVALRYPSDLGYEDNGFILPPLQFHHIETHANKPIEGRLFVNLANTLQERRSARRVSLEERVSAAARLANHSDESWLVWCDLNSESAALAAAIPDAVEVKGSDDMAVKEERLRGFGQGKYRVLVTKPSIAGFGLNWQHCHNMIFTGLSDSYEQFYQATRRCWRFGQQSPVDVHIITDYAEGNVLDNIKRKEIQATEMTDQLVARVAEYIQLRDTAVRNETEYRTRDAQSDDGRWRLLLGDCIERTKEIESDSVGLSIFSPPFPGMYAYTNSTRDIGNCAGLEEMLSHIDYLWPELLRVMQPGRSVCIHLTQMVKFKYLDGHSGMRDFRGRVIDAMEKAGFIYYGEVCIDKDPQVKAIRTKDAGLLFKTLAHDSSKMHMALADYLLQFRKPGENSSPIAAGISDRYENADGWITPDEWIEWAAPVWYRQTADYPGGIRETDVLSYREARTEQDDKHICPLQLGVIERAVKLWSAPGELVFSPFAGIGSEGYMALRLNRRFVGIELKPSYFDLAVRHLQAARASTEMPLEQYFDAESD